MKQFTGTEMSRDGKKGRKRDGLSSLSDVTLHDFADCPRPQSCTRLKKSLVGARAAGVIIQSSNPDQAIEVGDSLSWFEKDLEDFVINEIPSEQEEDLKIVGATSSSESKGHENDQADKSSGNLYPLDVWYWISLHLEPEDVGRFAGICKGTYSVTHTAAFWRALYDRVYRERQEGLPKHVKPYSMEKLHGLRARVICSFFYLHPPLAARVHGKSPMEDDPHSMKGHRCLLAWHQPATKGWQFCFKFQKLSLQPLSSRPVTKLDIYHGYNNLFHNPEAGCSILQVTCCHFASVAAVMGLLLNQVYVTLSAGFRHHRLRLHFDSHVSASQNTPSDTVVVLDDVISIKQLRWWHPGYPFTP